MVMSYDAVWQQANRNVEVLRLKITENAAL